MCQHKCGNYGGAAQKWASASASLAECVIVVYLPELELPARATYNRTQSQDITPLARSPRFLLLFARVELNRVLGSH